MNIIITGASRGIGFATALEFAKNGHQVLAIARSEKGLLQLQTTAKNQNLSGKILPLVGDVLDSLDIVKQVKSHFSEIDVLINNAGVLLNKPFVDISSEDLQKVYSVNVFAPFQLIRSLIPVFKTNTHVINIGSVGGVNDSQKFPGLSAYSSSKGALSILTECLQAEYAETDLSFNCLALGAVQTEMLSEAFPDYKADVDVVEMSRYIYNFSFTAPSVLRGKTVMVNRSNP